MIWIFFRKSTRWDSSVRPPRPAVTFGDAPSNKCFFSLFQSRLMPPSCPEAASFLGEPNSSTRAERKKKFWKTQTRFVGKNLWLTEWEACGAKPPACRRPLPRRSAPTSVRLVTKFFGFPSESLVSFRRKEPKIFFSSRGQKLTMPFPNPAKACGAFCSLDRMKKKFFFSFFCLIIYYHLSRPRWEIKKRRDHGFLNGFRIQQFAEIESFGTGFAIRRGPRVTFRRGLSRKFALSSRDRFRRPRTRRKAQDPRWEFFISNCKTRLYSDASGVFMCMTAFFFAIRNGGSTI